MALNNILSFSDLVFESDSSNKGLALLRDQILNMPLFFDVPHSINIKKKIVSKIPGVKKEANPNEKVILKIQSKKEVS